ncbi:hypothetical protein EDD22DRAFT_732608, partial [Suillus occidentalis]
GTTGIKLWDINSHKELLSLSHHESSRIVSCVVWATTRQTAVETLCYRTGLGYITFLQHDLIDNNFQEICARRLGSGFEITCLSCHSISSEGDIWIAVGTKDKMVQILILNMSSQLQSIFTVQLENTVPKSVTFADNKAIYVFGLYDGKLKLAVNHSCELRLLSTCTLLTLPSGHAAVCQKHGVFVVDNTTDGFTLYCLEGKGEPVQTFVTALPSLLVLKQVAFGEEGKVVVGGSDTRLAYIFDRKTGQVLETLHHTDAGLVQTIVVSIEIGHEICHS